MASKKRGSQPSRPSRRSGHSRGTEVTLRAYLERYVTPTEAATIMVKRKDLARKALALARALQELTGAAWYWGLPKDRDALEQIAKNIEVKHGMAQP
jgi:hypothetical protein